MNERLAGIHKELLDKSIESGSFEFEYFIEIWGVMWYPWFIEIDGKNQSFSYNDISTDDLKKLIELELVEFVKTYKKDDVERYVYKVINNSR